MSNFRKQLLFLSLFLAISSSAFCQHLIKPSLEEQSWRILYKAQSAFESGDYGRAMALCEESRKARQKEFEWNRYVMEYALNTPEVKRSGPFISDVIPVLKEREEYDALEIINSWVDHKGLDYFGNSLQKLNDYLKCLKAYPESDFLLAKIYRLEGEYNLSMEYLENARVQSDLLDVPAQKYDILYEMADLAKTMGNEKIYEETLLLIVADDGLYKDDAIKRAMAKAVQLKRADIADYFFTLFRFESITSIKAYFELSEIYSSKKNVRASWNMCALGAVCAFSHTLEILRDRSPEYSFTTLEKFFVECARYDDVLAWANKYGFWKGLYDFALLSVEMGWKNFGEGLLKNIQDSCPDEYWKMASLQKGQGSQSQAGQ